jgi:DNA-binding MarR family transcriptional regulator
MGASTVKANYLRAIALAELVHRRFLENAKHELERLGVRDLSSVQALILYHLDEEEMTVGELSLRGYYLGSNVSYNVKKMTEKGYLEQKPSPHDGRAILLSVSTKGRDVRARIDAAFDRQTELLDTRGLGANELSQLTRLLSRLDETPTFGSCRAA